MIEIICTLSVRIKSILKPVELHVINFKYIIGASLVAQLVKNAPVMREAWV